MSQITDTYNHYKTAHWWLSIDTEVKPDVSNLYELWPQIWTEELNSVNIIYARKWS